MTDVSAAAETFPSIISIGPAQTQVLVVDGVSAFLSIPYAAPPGRPCRFESPQVVLPWTDVR